MGKLREIYDGYKNLLLRDDTIESIAEKRIEDCDICDSVSYIIFEGLPYCNKCCCYIPALIRSPEKKCPKGKF